jgi:hypothetical protein
MLALERVNPNTFDPVRTPRAPHDALQLRDTFDGRGVGVFAARDVARGTLLTEYHGERIDERTHAGCTTHAVHVPGTRVAIDGAALRERLVRTRDGWTLAPNAGVGAFINSTANVRTGRKHRERANVELCFSPDGRCFVVSTRDLKGGEELLYFYNVK